MVKPRDDPTLQHALSLFQDAFGSEPDIAAFAPGRVNLIGEHTDYNEGFVFPLALDLRTFVVGRGSLLVRPPNQKVPLTQCRVTSESHQGIVSFVADKGLAPGEPKWVNYVKGVVAEYLKDVPQGKYLVFEAAIASSVPLGSGLSSSASLEVSVATFLEQVLGTTPGKVQKALRCQSAEHKFAHVPCGIMDQFVSAMGRTGKVLLLDCQSQQETLVPLADPDLVILVTNSKLDSIRNDLPELVYKRARHVVTEDIRTLRCVKALKNKDYQAAGQAMVESHESLRDDYEVSCDELDFLVAEAMKVPGVLGSRMTGGGFGGCTVTLVRKQAAGLAAMNIKAAYRARFGVEAETFVTTPSTGASVVDLKKDEEGGRGGGRKGGRAGKVRYAMAGVAVLGVVVAIAMGLARRKV
ncbi:galactokinase 1 [Nannochloropsis oceanica]